MGIGLGRAAPRHDRVHEAGMRHRPLERLLRAHREADHGADVGDARAAASTRRDASTLSRIAIAGKSGPACGAGVLLGDDDKPLPNISVAMRK